MPSLQPPVVLVPGITATNLRDEYPNLAAFLERVRGRPAWQRALKKGGPYQLLG